jgi:membrane protease YdiL (CAAX protease family)
MSDLNDKKRSSAGLFFILNFAWTWLFWIPAALSRNGSTPLITVLHLIGGIGPMLAALVLVYRAKDRQVRRDFWKRVIDLKRIKRGWYLVIFLIYPVLTVLPAVIDIWMNGKGIQPELASRFAQQPLLILPVTIFLLFFGPIPEELGWRGYALDRLQTKQSALVSSLIVGALWAFWHLPLFFINGTYHYHLGVGTTAFWIFMIEPIMGSIFYTWIYNNTHRSTLSAILLHFMGNYVGELFELSERAEILQLIFTILFAVIIVIIWGRKGLVKKSNFDKNISPNGQSQLLNKI